MSIEEGIKEVIDANAKSCKDSLVIEHLLLYWSLLDVNFWGITGTVESLECRELNLNEWIGLLWEQGVGDFVTARGVRRL